VVLRRGEFDRLGSIKVSELNRSEEDGEEGMVMAFSIPWKQQLMLAIILCVFGTEQATWLVLLVCRSVDQHLDLSGH
jgi:hypothetical protein